MKRIFDITFSIIALQVFAVPMIIIAFALKFLEKHPVFYLQKRTGKNKKSFMIFKFQTLVNDKPTVTGQILRRTGLDELPQFINVLIGDMSIVGPRALTREDINRLGWNDDFHKKRWKIKPGITGMAQLYGGQHRKTSWFWDKFYLKKNHVRLDFGIVIVSFLMNVFGKTRVRRYVFQKDNLR